MINALISLKIVFLLLLGALILDEVFLGIQTSETANFFGIRANHVGLNPVRVDDLFNRSIYQRMIFTKNNPFFIIEKIHTQTRLKTIETSFEVMERKYSTSAERVNP